MRARSPKNVYVVGSVISDRTTRNLLPAPTGRMAKNPANTMFIQDADAGFWIEFGNEADNTYDLNDRVTIHMYGQIIARDAYTNGEDRPAFVVGRAVVRAGSGGRADRPGRRFAAAVREPAGDAPQRGVRAPYGTLVNINESGYLGVEQGAAYQASADYNDLTIEYGHYVRDAKGNTTVSYTTWSFTERALSMIPEGAGDITGIVNKRCYKCDVYDGRDESRRKVESWCIRIRRESDITNFDADPATRLSKTIMQIGPWTDNGGAADRHGLRRAGAAPSTRWVSTSWATSGNTQQM